MAYEGPGTILGGLPVIAVVESGKDADTLDGPGEYWSEVQSLHWVRRDGSKGKELPEKVRDRAEAYDYGFCDLIEQVHDHLTYERYLAEQAARIVHHATCRADYPEKPRGEAPQAVTEVDGHIVCVDCGASVSVTVKLDGRGGESYERPCNEPSTVSASASSGSSPRGGAPAPISPAPLPATCPGAGTGQTASSR